MRTPEVPDRKVLVLGGSGFIGRHVVAALQAVGCPVVIGSRHPQRRRRQLPAGGAEYREIRFEHLLDAGSWRSVLDDCDIVINCVGILRERGRETYQRVHHLAPAALAAACAARGLRLIHVSALGLEAPVRSGFLRSKRDGEAALRASGADWCIVRPSLLDGEGGYGARWIRRVARWPIHVLPQDAHGRIAVLDVRDLGEAIARLALAPARGGDAREFDLGGLHARTLGEHLAAMRGLHAGAPARQLAIPTLLARLASHICDLLHVTPFSYGHWELLQYDNCPRRNRLPELLGRAPREVGVVAPALQPVAGVLRPTS
ncbi:NAD(P)H-binding protein [Lysobacter sp. CFH 32150]|uniref:NAD(P)H-binding protein n=1 Tax=Lysobacter sp. CFH 32150 TaxID=2927128 RepID=UPI001FA6E2ED|nr:NAD(P)H-binding protein [Lysobacter sp. CFH 32150]MCI4568120.1 NAD(P)H-binding protein [Lysobacter sp. CFH 32150]